MQRIHRAAIARIFSDLIKADRIIDTGEMRCWQQFRTRYGIDRELEVEATSMSLADAISAIRDTDDPMLGHRLITDCRTMTVSDGYCAHSEALLMVALMLTLDDNQEVNSEIISIPRADFNIDTATAIYIETGWDEEINAAIRRSHRVIFKELQLAGFHFIYLPYIIDHYRRTDTALLRQILSFLAPAMSDAGIANTLESLLDMTTAGFCKDILCNKCGISSLRTTYPSLLIKLSNSTVGDATYSNYLHLEVGPDIVETVQKFVDIFSDMLLSDVYVVNSSEEKDSQFNYHGFYKQLLDIFLVRRNIRSHILLDPYRSEISFPEIDTVASGLHRRERALYALLLCVGEEGLNFKAPAGADAADRHRRRLDRIQRRYALAYELFGGEPEKAPDLREPKIRRPIFACLRKVLKELPSLYNPDDYNVESDADGTFRVSVEPELVKITSISDSSPMQLSLSEFRRRIMAIS